MLGPDAPEADGRWTGWVLVAIGLAIFELTASAALGVAVACLKFGLEDARTALWLRGADPDRRRGRAVAGIYVAAALGKVSVVAFAVTIGGIALADMALGKPDALHRQLVGVMFLFLGGLVGLGLATVGAVVAALRARVRVWLGTGVHRARRAGAWPPWVAFRGGCDAQNRLERLLLPVLCLGYTVGLVVTVFVLLAPLRVRVPPGVIVVLAIGGQIGGGILVLVVRGWVLGRIQAETPQQCWPPSDSFVPSDDRPAWWDET